MHYVLIFENNDRLDGDLIDAFPTCSDSCSQQFCLDKGIEYGGWYGAMEIEFTTTCSNCEELIKGNDFAELLEESEAV